MGARAFSLLEVLLAMIVVALVMATLGPALIGTLKMERQARTILEPLAREQVAWALLREDLVGVPLPVPDQGGGLTDLYAVPLTVVSASVGGRRADTLTFCSLSRPPIHPSLAVRPAEMAEATVTWSLHTADDGVGMTWTRKRQPNLLATGVAPDPLEEVILDHLGLLAVDVYINGAWTGTYDSSQNSDTLPGLVRISYAFIDQNGLVGPARIRTFDLPQVAVVSP